ncbi:hypothetical protein ELG72_37620 [Rhizobium leguminosarum]|uniref:hypothetical protein n=1 Tax=Rhizobium TaxID=379 RepID=UPI0010311657|nr:hypothetical protein [Rhizobium leguminosarum]TBF87891.1 hypothetical protein ELG82_37480 [Rhizobium leguminosarum]TBG07128.1 hypothetical protein ELG80_37215 [Rhizobium leguminosarum]TBG07692.1 hypothetical protein ELG81_37520 [Rhizobium leguminosarum]TBG30812.1 hypothetical protein ELG75_36915 [Rhizobium leguminosarum]TBG50058.1 hypothetical protein ELG72_37620 [Rhizobium leguminosarum]
MAASPSPELPLNIPGEPFIEQMGGNEAMTGVMSAIKGAVVGGILDLVICLGIHVLFAEAVTGKFARITLDVHLPSLLG